MGGSRVIASGFRHQAALLFLRGRPKTKFGFISAVNSFHSDLTESQCSVRRHNLSAANGPGRLARSALRQGRHSSIESLVLPLLDSV